MQSEQRAPADAEVEVDEVWPASAPGNVAPENVSADLARCYLRLAHLPSFAFDRLNRYEAMLWRQVAQTLFGLDVLDRRK